MMSGHTGGGGQDERGLASPSAMESGLIGDVLSPVPSNMASSSVTTPSPRYIVESDTQMRDAMPMQRQSGTYRNTRTEKTQQIPQWEWNSQAIQSYTGYWYTQAKLFTLDRVSPTRIRRDWRPKHSHILLQTSFTVVSFVFFLLLYYFHGFNATVSGYGQPQDLTCHDIAWSNCGLNGGDCQPFESKQWTAYRCPHRCKLLNIKDSVIGGGPDAIYRADSHICNSAIHAGVTSDTTGGCFLWRPAGVQAFFEGDTTNQGLTSEAYPSWFPGSMQLVSVDSKFCSNFGVAILIIGIFWFVPLAIMRPHPMLLWFIMLYWGYWYIALTLNDRDTPSNLFWLGTLNSTILGAFGYLLYFTAPKMALLVPVDYAERAKSDFPWRCICSRLPGGKKIRSSHSRSRTESKSRRHSHDQADLHAPEGSQTAPRLSVPSTNQVQDSFNILVSSTSSSSHSSAVRSSEGADVGAGEIAPVQAHLHPRTTMTIETHAPASASEAALRSDSTSPLGSPSAAVEAQRHALVSPLINDGSSAMYSPSPSPTPSPNNPSASPEATSVFYHPPSASLTQDAEIRSRRVGKDGDGVHEVAEVSLQRRDGTNVREEKLVLRPWYELYLLYILPFLLAIHFSYLIYIPGFSDINLDSTFFDHGATGAVIIVCFLLIVLVTVVYHMKMAFRENLLFRYLLYYLYVGLGIMFISVLFHASASFHLHHVLVGILLIPITRFQSKVSLIAQAVAMGIFLNGLSIWGFSISWDINTSTPYTGNRYNAAPPLYQLTNATASTVIVAWQTYSNRSDAIGATLFLNDIEIVHSTFMDTTFGGGHTPYNSSSPHTSMFLSPHLGMERVGSHSELLNAPVIDLPSHILQVPLPYAPSTTLSTSKRTGALRANPKPHLSTGKRLLPSPTAHVNSATVDAGTTSSHRLLGDPLPVVHFGNSTRTYFLFQLTNLLPNTTYELYSGYLLPSGYYSISDAIEVTTTYVYP